MRGWVGSDIFYSFLFLSLVSFVFWFFFLCLFSLFNMPTYVDDNSTYQDNPQILLVMQGESLTDSYITALEVSFNELDDGDISYSNDLLRNVKSFTIMTILL